jgi:hypothetical protein
MNDYSTWEMLILAALTIVILIWWGQGMGGVSERSRNAPRDWPAALIPLALVAIFVIFLILLV